MPTKYRIIDIHQTDAFHEIAITLIGETGHFIGEPRIAPRVPNFISVSFMPDNDKKAIYFYAARFEEVEDAKPSTNQGG